MSHLSDVLYSGDVLVLGLKRKEVRAATASGEAKPGGDAKSDKQQSEADTNKKLNTDLAPLGGEYEFVLEPVDAQSHNLVRVLGAIFRRSGEDKVSQ